jgi:putative inorganic carbon (HCO3(-)) transporter
MLHSITFISLLILIVWLPLPYGSNHGWAWAVMEVWIFGLALLWLWQYVRGRHKLTPVFYKAIPILVIWVIWLLYITFQCTPLPYAWIQWLSPQAAEAYAFFNPTHTTLSVDSHSTAVGLLKSLSYVLLFTLTLLLVNTRSRLRWVAYALVLSGLFQAVYGSLMTLSGLEYGFFHEKVYGRGLATGTFINRNHLAGYLEMCLAMGIGLLIAQLGDGTSYETWRQRLVAVLSWVMSPKMVLRLTLVLLVIALVMTHSRMGNTAFFASMLIAGILALILSRHANRATIILLVSLIVIDIFIVGAWFGLEKVKHRLEQTSLATETRDEVDIYSIPYWQDYFWTGSGLGSYYTTFPRYQGADVKGFWDHAHNDYLEFAAETGVIGAWLLGVALLLTLAMVLNTLYRRRALNRGIAFGVTMAIIALLIHSIVDFNLQIPANAATFMLILGLGWVAGYLPTTMRKKNLSHTTVILPPSPLAKSVALSLMAGLIYLIYVAGSWGFADSIARQARTQMAQWPEQQFEKAEWTTTYETSALALRLSPHNPDLLMTMGQVYYWQAIKMSGGRTEKLAAYQQALDYFLTAIEQKPTETSIWGQIIFLKHALRQYDAQFLAALEYAVVYGPRKYFAQHVVADVGLATWYRLPKNVQSIVIATIEQGMAAQPNIIRGLIKKHKRKWVVCAYRDQQAGLIKFCQ